MKDFNFEEWHEKYLNYEYIDLKKYFNESDIEIINKLGLEVKDKLYTNYEFDILNGDYIMYYYDEEEMDEEELKETKSLEGTGVSREEYNDLLKKFEEILVNYEV